MLNCSPNFRCILTGAVRVAKSDDSARNSGTASLVGAVTKTISEVNVLAQASSVRGRASERWSQVEHIVDTCLLQKMLALDRKTI